MKITIHSNPRIPWQHRLTSLVKKGLKRHGVTVDTSSVAKRQPGTDVAIIFGPTFWKPIENSSGPYIVMNRKFLGFDERDVHDNVAISWDGFNGRGTFCVDETDPKRFNRYIKPEDFEEWREPGTNYLMCEQSDVGRNSTFSSMAGFYKYVEKNAIGPVRMRKKVNPENMSMNQFRLEFRRELQEVKAAVVLNSTISSEMLLAGIPVISIDRGDPNYAINSHDLNSVKYPDRLPFLQYLAHCQWHYDEIESGDFWQQIYPKRGPMLCEWEPNIKE